MCSSGKKSQPLPEPVRYSQQKSPVRRDATDAQDRVKKNRLKATKTLLAPNDSEVDNTSRKTLLGGGAYMAGS